MSFGKSWKLKCNFPGPGKFWRREDFQNGRASQRGPGGPPGVHSAISGGPHKNAMSAHMSASYKT